VLVSLLPHLARLRSGASGTNRYAAM
jgi:hypothetical protein